MASNTPSQYSGLVATIQEFTACRHCARSRGTEGNEPDMALWGSQSVKVHGEIRGGNYYSNRVAREGSLEVEALPIEGFGSFCLNAFAYYGNHKTLLISAVCSIEFPA